MKRRTKRDDDKSADDASPNILSKPSSPTLSENSIVFPTEKASTTVKKVADKLRKDKPVDRVKPNPSNEKGRSEKSHDSSKSGSKAGQSSIVGKSNQSQDEVVPAERKVSRYSERRNKIKEKQNSKVAENTDAVQVTDESKNHSGEINNSEV